LAFFELERHAVERDNPAEPQGDIANLEQLGAVCSTRYGHQPAVLLDTPSRPRISPRYSHTCL